MEDYSTRLDATISLKVPELEELKTVLDGGLSSVYEHHCVSVVECPDLSLPPFNFASVGICGQTTTVDVGGPNNLYPKLRKDKKFDIRKICDTIGYSDGAFAIGPGAGPFFKSVGCNCEMMANYCFKSNGEEKIGTKLAKIVPETGSYLQVDNDNSEFALMANLLVSKGAQGKVLKVSVKRRLVTGDDPHSTSFPVVLQNILAAHYGRNRIVSMGGVFLMKQGKARFHVMPDFYDREFESFDEINNSWLKYFEVSAPLVCLSVVHSTDPDGKLSLRLEHTHCYSDHGDAGHLHYDTTPEQVEIEGYFVPAERLCRVDLV